MKLKDILGKETISIYEAGQVVESVGKLFQNFERTTMGECEYVTEQANTLLKSIASFRENVLAKYQEIEELAKKTEDIGNEQYKRIRDAHESLRRRVEQLPEIQVSTAPYGMKELLDIAERCSRYSEEEWARVIDLAKALANKGD